MQRARAALQSRTIPIRRAPIPQSCPSCGRAIVPLDEALGLFGLEGGKVYRDLDCSAIHCQQRDDGRFWICVVSVLRLHA